MAELVSARYDAQNKFGTTWKGYKKDKILLLPDRKYPQLSAHFRYICLNILTDQTVLNPNKYLLWQITLKKRALKK